MSFMRCRNRTATRAIARRLGAATGLALALLLASCGREPPSPQPQAPALAAFGERLFFDAALSSNGRQSCASCHLPAKHFTDAKPVSIGAAGIAGTRNAPSLEDVRLLPNFFWDGRETRLEHLVIQPFTNPAEMALKDPSALVGLVAGRREYKTLAGQAFGDEAIDADKIGLALAAYLRSLPLRDTAYDRHLAARGDPPLNQDQLAGMALFTGKAACAECHVAIGSPAPFTDNRFHHAGIGFEQVSGNIARMIERLDALKRERRPIGEAILADREVAELGRFAVTRRPADLGAFRTPSLRNVASTAPYMHDGSVSTLRDAVEREIYYRSLARGRPISLTVTEQRQLIAFLEALSTDETPGAN